MHEELFIQQKKIADRATELLNLAPDDFTDDVVKELEELKTHSEKIKEQIGRYEALSQIAQISNQIVMPRSVAPQSVDAPPQQVTHGFSNLGEFGSAVARSTITERVDPRLLSPAYLAQSQAERTGVEGGYLVPADIAPNVQIIHMGEMSLLSLADTQPVSGNSFEFAVEENVPHDFTGGGVVAYWTSELKAGTRTYADIRKNIFRLEDLMALVPASNQVLDDTAQLDALLRQKMPEAIVARVNQAMMRGTGAGQPQGVIGASCAITVPREVGQNPNTVQFENVAKMLSRADPDWLARNARWMINSQVLPQLLGMTVNVKNVAGSENVGGSAVYIPGGNIAGAPFGTLYGIPVMMSEWCKPLGTVGDIMLVIWGGYTARTKAQAGGIEISTHLLFDQNASMFRMAFRVAGFPSWSKEKPPADAGGDSKSIVVQLGAPAT